MFLPRLQGDGRSPRIRWEVSAFGLSVQLRFPSPWEMPPLTLLTLADTRYPAKHVPASGLAPGSFTAAKASSYPAVGPPGSSYSPENSTDLVQTPGWQSRVSCEPLATRPAGPMRGEALLPRVKPYLLLESLRGERRGLWQRWPFPADAIAEPETNLKARSKFLSGTSL